MKVNCKIEKKFVIFGRGRSGTTALVSLMNSVPKVHCDGEILHQFVDDPILRIEEKCHQSKESTYGFKVLSYQIRNVQPIDDGSLFLKSLQEHGFSIIYLKRENLLFHALSNIRARAYAFHAKSSESSEFSSKKIYINIEELMHWLEGSQGLEEYELKILEDIPHLSLSYEKHIANAEVHQETLASICNFLEIPYHQGKTEFKKISPRTLKDSIENFEEVVEYLNGTPYKKYI